MELLFKLGDEADLVVGYCGERVGQCEVNRQGSNAGAHRGQLGIAEAKGRRGAVDGLLER